MQMDTVDYNRTLRVATAFFSGDALLDYGARFIGNLFDVEESHVARDLAMMRKKYAEWREQRFSIRRWEGADDIVVE
jgi:hypothetical protein